MGLFKKKPPLGPIVAASDSEWWRRSNQRYEETVGSWYGSPETLAAGGNERMANGDVGTASFFYRKSIDLLHTHYGFLSMDQRRPSGNDQPLIDRYLRALDTSLAEHPGAPVDESVREVTHRLRSIASTCELTGLPSGLYRSALDRLAVTAPAVDVSDIFWN